MKLFERSPEDLPSNLRSQVNEVSYVEAMTCKVLHVSYIAVLSVGKAVASLSYQACLCYLKRRMRCRCHTHGFYSLKV